MFENIKEFLWDEFDKLKVLLHCVPSIVMALFTVSVILMNLLANKEIDTGLSWLALDCGLIVSWLSFLCMDMLTKRFGPQAAFRLSLIATGVNLIVCGILFVVSKIPGNWGEFYTYNNEIINNGLNATIGGTWYVLLGSTIAFICSSALNSVLNHTIGKLCTKNNFQTYALRSYISTLFAQFVDNLIFSLIVSHTFFSWTLVQCITCSLTGCIVELLCEVIFSPIGYKVCKRWEDDKIGEDYIVHITSKERINE